MRTLQQTSKLYMFASNNLKSSNYYLQANLCQKLLHPHVIAKFNKRHICMYLYILIGECTSEVTDVCKVSHLSSMYVSHFLHSIHNKSISKDGLTPRPSPISHGDPEIKLPKARIVLGWVTLLPLDFWCTLPPMFYPVR